jgi:GT2 family glycosyltransferase
MEIIDGKSHDITYEHDSRNLGFSYANNRMILNSKYQSILLLNPDVFGLNYDIWQRIKNLDLEYKIHFIKLLNKDNTFQDCIGQVSSLKRALGRKVNYGLASKEISVEMGIMAFMLANKKAYAKIGLLDCRYSLYAEDMDWCYRAGKSGYQIVFNPQISLVHIGGGSSKQMYSNKKILIKKYISEALFINIHYNGVYWLLMRLLNYIKLILVYTKNSG